MIWTFCALFAIFFFVFFKRRKPKVDVVIEDFWVGLYYSRKRQRMFICPVPTIVFSFDYKLREMRRDVGEVKDAIEG